jgi:hypothetical protein
MSIREANANRVLQLGNTNSERTKNSMITMINREFSSSPSYHETLRNNVPQGFQIVDENAITKNPNKKRVLCKPDEDINIGDDIIWNTEHWLCTNVDSDKEIYAKGIIERCNNTLKWQTSTGEIKEYPCIIQDKTSVYSTGVEENKYLSLADDQILITIQYNNDTKQLRQDKRFIFNHSEYEIYKLTKPQTLTNAGVLYLTMTKSQKGTNDNLELNIADYVQNNYTLTILNGDIVSLNTAQTLQLSCELRNNGILVENPIITYNSSDLLVASISSTGLITALQVGMVTVSATSNGVSDSLTVNVEAVPVNNYSIEFVSPSLILYQGQSKTYSVKTYNNGLEITDKAVTFTISDSTLASITSQSGLSCVVKGSSSGLGVVTLKCEMVEDNTVFSTISIQVKSIV